MRPLFVILVVVSDDEGESSRENGQLNGEISAVIKSDPLLLLVLLRKRVHSFQTKGSRVRMITKEREKVKLVIFLTWVLMDPYDPLRFFCC